MARRPKPGTCLMCNTEFDPNIKKRPSPSPYFCEPCDRLRIERIDAGFAELEKHFEGITDAD